MVSITKYWNTEENYWLLNPMMKSVPLFNKLFEGDNTKYKHYSSKIMWAIVLLVDPNDNNPWRNLVEEERKDLLFTDFVKDKRFSWEDEGIIELIDEYTNRCLTISEKQLVMYEKKLVERTRFISVTPYSLDVIENGKKTIDGSAKQLDDMLIKSTSIYANIEKLREIIFQESTDSRTKGDSVESAGESGML